MYLEYFDKFRNMSPYLHIDKGEWSHILSTYAKDDIIDALSEVLTSYPPPIPNITNEEAVEAYRNLKGTWWPDILIEGKWFPRNGVASKYPLTFDGGYQYFKRINVGNNASNPFHIQTRWKVDHVRSLSGWRAWQSQEGIKTVIRAFFTLDELLLEVSEETLRTATVLRKYVASQFKPAIAKAFYDRFGSVNVLDFSAGWGDRLAGFFAAETTRHYVGIDPNTDNHPNYQRQIDFYQRHKTFFEADKRAEMIQSPAEDVDYSKYENYFDTVFTSPPYFNTEKYSTDDTQSWVRYKGIEAWNKGFLHTTLHKIVPTLKPGGILAINIADVFSAPDNGYVDITNAMNDYIQSEGLHYRGCIGMEMTKRYNSGGAGTARSDYFADDLKEKAEETKDQAFAEPIWIWQK